jgi:large subunit ribosomal protein L21
MYAVIVTGGQQHKVELGEKLKIEKLDLEVGSTVEFDKILLVADGKDVKIGAPYVEGVIVSAEVVAQERAKKIEILKFKRRKHHMKRQGHRQYYSEIKIMQIGDKKFSKVKEAPKAKAAPKVKETPKVKAAPKAKAAPQVKKEQKPKEDKKPKQAKTTKTKAKEAKD